MGRGQEQSHYVTLTKRRKAPAPFAGEAVCGESACRQAVIFQGIGGRHMCSPRWMGVFHPRQSRSCQTSAELREKSRGLLLPNFQLCNHSPTRDLKPIGPETERHSRKVLGSLPFRLQLLNSKTSFRSYEMQPWLWPYTHIAIHM